jgi:hypothetical protein
LHVIRGGFGGYERDSNASTQSEAASTLIQPVLIDAFVGFVLGVSIACGMWYVVSAKRRALRIIDFLSYAITAIAFGSAFFSLRHNEERLNNAFERLQFFDLVSDNRFDDTLIYSMICTETPQERLSVLKKQDCDQLGNYLRLSTTAVSNRNIQSLPDIKTYSSPDVIELIKQISAHVQSTNQLIENTRAKAEKAGFDPVEVMFVSYALPILALAFGLGVSRRAIDLYSDWKRQ